MTITLNPKLEKLIAQRVSRGDYASADALVQQAIESLIEVDLAADLKRDEILASVDRADSEIDRGEFTEFDEDSIKGPAREIHQRGLKRL